MYACVCMVSAKELDVHSLHVMLYNTRVPCVSSCVIVLVLRQLTAKEY